MLMRKIAIYLAIFGLVAFVLGSAAIPARATIFGNVKGVVHDPQHRPIQDATVYSEGCRIPTGRKLKRPATTESLNLPPCRLAIIRSPVMASGFQQQQQSVIVRSDTSPCCISS